MPFVPTPNTLRAEIIFLWDSQQVENVFHIRTPNVINESELDSVHTVMNLWYDSYLSAMQPSAVSLLKYVIADASDQFGVSKEYAPTTRIQGQVSSSPSMPNNVTLAIKWNTGFRGRSYRGRTFHIGLWESAMVGNNIASDVLANFISTYTQLITSLDGSTRELGVVSKFQGNVQRTEGVFTPIRTVTCDGVVDSQRRRLPGRGA